MENHVGAGGTAMSKVRKSLTDSGRMTVLETHDLEAVYGGEFGTGPGGIFSPTNLARAGRFAGGLGLLYTSYQVGFGIGTAIYNRYTSWAYR